MPKLTTRTPKMRRHTKGEICYAVVSLDGQQFHLGLWGTKIAKANYDRMVGEWLVTGRAPSLRQGVLVDDILAGYLTEMIEDKGDDSNQVYSVKALCRLVSPIYGHTGAEEFGPRSLKALRQQLVDQDLSRGYVNDQIKRLKSIFKWGASEELVSGSTYQNLQSVAGLRKGKARESRPVVAVKDEVIELTVENLKKHSPTVARMVKVHRLMGCRPTELCDMKWAEIDRQDPVWVYTPSEHKTDYKGKARMVPIGPRAQQQFPELSDGYVFQGKPGKCYTEDSYRNAVKRACVRVFPIPDQWSQLAGENVKAWKTRLKKVGSLEAMEEWRNEYHWSPNRLRHARATQLRAEHGLEAAQVTLGHARADVTQIYAAANAELAMVLPRI